MDIRDYMHEWMTKGKQTSGHSSHTGPYIYVGIQNKEVLICGPVLSLRNTQ